MNWASITTLVGVVVGWVLGQLHERLAARREERRAVARVLFELLELRHRLLAVPAVVEQLTKPFGAPPETQTRLGAVLGALIPPDSLKKYEESVCLVAAHSPLLAYRLRSQDLASSLLNQLRAMAASRDDSALLWQRLEPRILMTFV